MKTKGHHWRHHVACLQHLQVQEFRTNTPGFSVDKKPEVLKVLTFSTYVEVQILV